MYAITIAANTVSDTAGTYVNTAALGTFTITDMTPLTVTIDKAADQLDPATTLPIHFTVVFNKTMATTAFTGLDVTLRRRNRAGHAGGHRDSG